ncbi:F1 complex, OSCP/delta subunit of ATPase [Neoconidiobolus thromboides FSU 785]|nr:F1 complex, OSCP/delta subunit of ATPase [Neoconidiobolus thromboides FSU 785]
MSAVIRALKLTRGYATAAKTVQVPLSLHGIEGRYATALYTAAVKNNTLDAVDSDLSKVQSHLEKSAQLKVILEDPTLKFGDKKKVIETLLGSVKANTTTKNFFDVLIENSRLSESDKIITAFKSLISAHRGELQITVTSAQPLENDVLKQLKDTLTKSKLASGSKTISIKNQVKPTILGGLIVDFGDKTIDLSVSSKINKLTKALTDAI